MTGITRRRLLALGAGAAFIAIARPRAVMAEEMSMPMDSDMPMGPALPLPPLVEPDASGLVKLKIEKGRHSFVKGSEAESAGVNGAYLGPLVRLKNGDKITLCVENGMDEDTTLHWHGLFVPAALDGGPHNIIAAGGRWQPQVTVGQPASFNWFHPHLDGGTARQAHMGIAGLMVGRTPEYIGKKIEAKEVKMSILAMLGPSLAILALTAIAVVLPVGLSSIQDAGPHGLSEVLYAFTSGANNNGSAFAGLSANTPFYNITIGLAMLMGRFLLIVPVLAIAGSLAAKKSVPASTGTLPTTGPLFIGLVVGVTLIVGGLTFFPVLALGPIVEHFAMLAGQTF